MSLHTDNYAIVDEITIAILPIFVSVPFSYAQNFGRSLHSPPEPSSASDLE